MPFIPSAALLQGSLPSSLAGYEFGYDAITADVTVSSTTEASGTTIISCAAHTFDGGAVIAEFFTSGIVLGSGSGAECVVSLFEGATQIARLCDVYTSGTNTEVSPVFCSFRFTPTAASHTYTVTAYRAVTNATVRAGASGTGAYVAAYMRFTKA